MSNKYEWCHIVFSWPAEPCEMATSTLLRFVCVLIMLLNLKIDLPKKRFTFLTSNLEHGFGELIGYALSTIHFMIARTPKSSLRQKTRWENWKRKYKYFQTIGSCRKSVVAENQNHNKVLKILSWILEWSHILYSFSLNKYLHTLALAWQVLQRIQAKQNHIESKQCRIEPIYINSVISNKN